jgi:hypothetical protein
MSRWILRRPDIPSEPLVLRWNQKPFAWSPAFATFAAGGWGSRKTWAGLGFIDESAWLNPGTTGIVMAPTHSLLRELVNTYIRPAFKEMIVGESVQDGAIYLVGNRRIICLSAHIPERLEMYTAAWGYMDEAALMKRDIYVRMVARIRDRNAKRPRLGITSVPHWCWLKEEFEGRDDMERKILHLRTDDNTDLHPQAAQRQRDSCSVRMAPCYLEGMFVPPGGTVHPGFGEKNLIDWEHNRDFETCCVIDWSPRTPAVLFYQIIPAGVEVKGVGRLTRKSIVIFDEMHPGGPDDVITTPFLCRDIKAHNYPLSKFVCDPAGKGVEATSGTSNIRLARQHLGLPYRTPPPNLASKKARIEHVNLALEPLTGHPTLFVSKRLEKNHQARGVVNSFRAYSYPKGADGKPLDENPHEDGITEHAMDDVQYIVSVELPSFPRLTRKPPRSYI